MPFYAKHKKARDVLVAPRRSKRFGNLFADGKKLILIGFAAGKTYPDCQKSRFTTEKKENIKEKVCAKFKTQTLSKAKLIYQIFAKTLALQGFSLFSANKSPNVPTYADGALLTKCNFLFGSLPACQRGFFDTL